MSPGTRGDTACAPQISVIEIRNWPPAAPAPTGMASWGGEQGWMAMTYDRMAPMPISQMTS